MKSTMQVTRSAPVSARITARSVSVRKTAASTSTPSTPKAADSSGVAMPSTISPITAKMTTPIGRSWLAISRSLRPSETGTTSYCGAASGSIRT